MSRKEIAKSNVDVCPRELELHDLRAQLTRVTAERDRLIEDLLSALSDDLVEKKHLTAAIAERDEARDALVRIDDAVRDGYAGGAEYVQGLLAQLARVTRERDEALEDREAAVQGMLCFLDRSGSTGNETAQKIERLRTEVATLTTESDALRAAMPTSNFDRMVLESLKGDTEDVYKHKLIDRLLAARKP